MEQPPDLSGSPKVVQLTAAGSQRIFKEKISGATADRPQLKKLMATIGPDDLVVIPLSKAPWTRGRTPRGFCRDERRALNRTVALTSGARQ